MGETIENRLQGDYAPFSLPFVKKIFFTREISQPKVINCSLLRKILNLKLGETLDIKF
jgi:hypothetical protein